MLTLQCFVAQGKPAIHIPSRLTSFSITLGLVDVFYGSSPFWLGLASSANFITVNLPLRNDTMS
ncbi:hypothetical protein M440DRAFT_1169780 [Trichoderma longibrachiatum ATCC 18648]|uniref:Uncharacterized protein n=1 Tax=Trichoderma longibrachiatum ATCC 18648 TaxID=983965 RepID=A0A2T4CD16_TRILO|nr:hypothetical protein M440DRAFT_1169780 [Trichoderma longibrachiatum ATCC 18648]